MQAAKRVFGIIDQPSRIDAVAIDQDQSKVRIVKENVRASRSKKTKHIEGQIEFVNVWFQYPTRKADWVLRGLNMVISPHETVALVGESGCGKSTIVSLLMRYYDVDFGEILIDGVNIKDYNLHDLRTSMSLVMQEPILFNYSILDNVLYGKENARNSEVLRSTQISNAFEFISNFEQLQD